MVIMYNVLEAMVKHIQKLFYGQVAQACLHMFLVSQTHHTHMLPCNHKKLRNTGICGSIKWGIEHSKIAR